MLACCYCDLGPLTRRQPAVYHVTVDACDFCVVAGSGHAQDWAEVLPHTDTVMLCTKVSKKCFLPTVLCTSLNSIWHAVLHAASCILHVQ